MSDPIKDVRDCLAFWWQVFFATRGESLEPPPPGVFVLVLLTLLVVAPFILASCATKVTGRVEIPVELSETERALIDKAATDATPEEARELLALVADLSTYECEFSAILIGVSDGKLDCPKAQGETGGVMEAGAQGPSEIMKSIWEAGFGMVSTIVQGALALVGQQLPLPNAGGSK